MEFVPIFEEPFNDIEFRIVSLNKLQSVMHPLRKTHYLITQIFSSFFKTSIFKSEEGGIR